MEVKQTEQGLGENVVEDAYRSRGRVGVLGGCLIFVVCVFVTSFSLIAASSFRLSLLFSRSLFLVLLKLRFKEVEVPVGHCGV